MSATVVAVRAASAYDVVIGPGVSDTVGTLVPAGVRRIAVCVAEPLGWIADSVEQALLQACPGVDLHRIVLPDGEAAKTAEVVAQAWARLGEAGLTRSDLIVTVGGGATTDLGGFIAATWLRGVAVVHVPTTLLAMVDAAVGGKTGMNTAAGKNLVGAFHEPAGVVCDLDLLRTLPQAELVSGLAEVIKCGFIADPEILTVVERAPEMVLDPATAQLRELVERAVRVKATVVGGDLRETGGPAGGPGREALNYGHTLAHALERHTGYRLRHGEAVSLGMVYVAELARAAGRLDEATAARHVSALASVGLPVRLTDPPDFEDLRAIMAVDKKARGDELRFVVLDALAAPAILAGPSPELLRSAYARLTG